MQKTYHPAKVLAVVQLPIPVTIQPLAPGAHVVVVGLEQQRLSHKLTALRLEGRMPWGLGHDGLSTPDGFFIWGTIEKQSWDNSRPLNPGSGTVQLGGKWSAL